MLREEESLPQESELVGTCGSSCEQKSSLVYGAWFGNKLYWEIIVGGKPEGFALNNELEDKLEINPNSMSKQWHCVIKRQTKKGEKPSVI